MYIVFARNTSKQKYLIICRIRIILNYHYLSKLLLNFLIIKYESPIRKKKYKYKNYLFYPFLFVKICKDTLDI